MSENQTSAKSTVEGELGLDDLEKIAGGTADLASTATNPYAADSSVLIETDSMWTSYDGTQGSSLQNENSTRRAMNMSNVFP